MQAVAAQSPVLGGLKCAMFVSQQWQSTHSFFSVEKYKWHVGQMQVAFTVSEILITSKASDAADVQVK